MQRFIYSCPGQVYLPMSHIYGRRNKLPASPLAPALRHEMYCTSYESVDWARARNACAKPDSYYPHPLVQVGPLHSTAQRSMCGLGARNACAKPDPYYPQPLVQVSSPTKQRLAARTAGCAHPGSYGAHAASLQRSASF